jgi:hypothetical protein
VNKLGERRPPSAGRARRLLGSWHRVSAEQFFGDRPPSSTALLRRAAETDLEAASFLSVHPRSVDGGFYSSIYSNDEMLIRQMSDDSAFHGTPHHIAAAHRTKTECLGSVPDAIKVSLILVDI